MKKNLFIILILGLSFSSFSQNEEHEQKHRAIKNGISFNTSIGFNTEDMGLNVPEYNWDKHCYIHLQFGTRWYIRPKGKLAFGIKVNWIDFSYTEASALLDTTSQSSDGLDETTCKKFISFSFLTFGPVGTFAISKNIGFDLFYQLRPTYVRAETSRNNIGIQPGFGVSHIAGCALRIGVFNLGAEYVFGKISPFVDKIDNTINGGNTSGKIGKISSDYFRIIIGCKF